MIVKDVNEIFLILGIEPIKDKKEIKKAYSNKVKTVHPEENQQEWTSIYNAYKEAILWSEQKEPDNKPEIKQRVGKEEDKPEIKQRESKEDIVSTIIEDGCTEDEDSNFNVYLEEINAKQKEMNESLENLVLYLDKVRGKKKIYYFEWKRFFKLIDYNKACFHPDFIKMFHDKLWHISISSRSKKLILKKLEEVWKEWEMSSCFSTGEEKQEKEDKINYSKYCLDVACVTKWNGIDERLIIIIVLMLVVVFAIIIGS